MKTKQCSRCLLPDGMALFTPTAKGKLRDLCDDCFKDFGRMKGPFITAPVRKTEEPVRIYEECGMVVKVMPPAEAEGARLSVDNVWARFGITQMFQNGGHVGDRGNSSRD